MPFKIIVAGTSTFPLNPGAFQRVLAEADCWGHFRVRRFKFRILDAVHTDTNVSPTSYLVVGYCGGIQDTPPNSLTGISELLPSVCKPANSYAAEVNIIRHTCPTEWIKVPPKELAGPLPWYKTVAGTADATEEAPGSVCILATTNVTGLIEYAGVFEFKTSIDPANVPEYKALLAKFREERRKQLDATERAKLVTILGTPGVSPTAKKILP